MRQMGMAFSQYIQDFDEQFPHGLVASDNTPSQFNGAGWSTQVAPYVGNGQLFRCPSERPPGTYYSSYGYNSNIVDHNFAHRRLVKLIDPARTILGFEVSSNVMNWPVGQEPPNYANNGATKRYSSSGTGTFALFQESRANYLNGQKFAFGNAGGRFSEAEVSTTCGYNNCTYGPLYTGVNGRHLGGANYLFADGHVKWLPPSQVSTGQSASSPSSAQQTGNAALNSLRAAGTANTVYAATFSTI